MARARNIKPGFFTNDELVQIEPLGRLLFIGLWTMADREGRLEDRPLKIKLSVLPGDDCSVVELLDALERGGFIRRYRFDVTRYIQIVNWHKHQNPHIKEAPSDIPPPPHETSPEPEQVKTEASIEQAPDKHDASTVLEPDSPRINPADSGFLIPDSGFLIKPSAKKSPRASGDDAFDTFWTQYPRKQNKPAALKAWRKLAPSPELVDEILAAVALQRGSDDWTRDGGRFIPHASTWLNGQRWADEVIQTRPLFVESDRDRQARETIAHLTGRARRQPGKTENDPFTFDA